MGIEVGIIFNILVEIVEGIVVEIKNWFELVIDDTKKVAGIVEGILEWMAFVGIVVKIEVGILVGMSFRDVVAIVVKIVVNIEVGIVVIIIDGIWVKMVVWIVVIEVVGVVVKMVDGLFMIIVVGILV